MLSTDSEIEKISENEEREKVQGHNMSTKSDRYRSDERYQSSIFKSPQSAHTKMSFKLEDILKKRFKNLTRVQKYKSLEEKIVFYILICIS